MCMPEAGRTIIQDQVAIGGAGLPWEDRLLFADLMLSWDMRSYRDALDSSEGRPVFFDRGVPDIIGYLSLEGLESPDRFYAAAEICSYNPTVFIAPPWPEIYEQDSERRQGPDLARRTYEAMVRVYRELGYTLCELPRESVEDRVDFILSYADV